MCVSVKFYFFLLMIFYLSFNSLGDKNYHNDPRFKKHSKYKSRQAANKTLVEVPINSRTQFLTTSLEVTISIALSL